jgi:hypothetical protein
MREGDDALNAMPHLEVAQVVQQVAHLQLSSLSHLHRQQALAMLVFSFCKYGLELKIMGFISDLTPIVSFIPSLWVNHQQQLVHVLIG